MFFVECLYFSLRMRMILAVKTQSLVMNIPRWILLLLCSIFLSTPKQGNNMGNICAEADFFLLSLLQLSRKLV